MLSVRNTIPHIAAIAVIAACIWLAQWQLERAVQKRVILDKWNNQAPVELATVTRPFDLPQPVTGVGIWDPDHQILIDNRIRDQRPGVQVLTPFRIPDGRIFLVNRGWASWPSRSDELPDPAISDIRVNARPDIFGDILGVLNNPPGTGVRLGQSEIRSHRGWPVLATYFDYAALAGIFGEDLQPAVIQLDPDHHAHLSGDPWQVVTFGPDRHIGYAMTWTSVAVVVAAIWLVLTLHQVRKRKHR